MTSNWFTPPSVRGDADYEEIEAAVMETERGRWFLAEFALRNRSADTNMLLDAIHKLQIALQDRRPPDGLGNLRSDLMEMATSIAQTRRDLAAMPVNPDEAGGGNGELDSIVATTEKATSDILNIAEQVQEIAWTLREQGVSAEACDTLNAHATSIYTACSFQDITGQRISKVIAILNDIETRLNALVDVWGFDDIEIKPLEAPQAGASGGAGERRASHFPAPLPSQRDIDVMLVAPGAKTPAAVDDDGVPPNTEDIGWREPPGAHAPAAQDEMPDEAARMAAPAQVEAPAAQDEVPDEAARMAAPAQVAAPAAQDEMPDEAARMETPAQVAAPAEKDEKGLALFDQLAADLAAATRLPPPSPPPAPRSTDQADASSEQETENSAAPAPAEAPQPDPDTDTDTDPGTGTGTDFDQLPEAHKTALFS